VHTQKYLQTSGASVIIHYLNAAICAKKCVGQEKLSPFLLENIFHQFQLLSLSMHTTATKLTD